MPKIYGEIQNAALENLASDPTPGVAGRIIRNTTDGKVKIDNGTAYKAAILNDDKAIIGTSGTESSNTRLHRGAAGVTQLVSGADTTAEGTLSTVLNQLSAKVENYTDAGKPAAGNAGRLVWITDINTMKVDNGSSYQVLGSGGGGSAIQWTEPANAPYLSTLNNMQGYSFGNGLDQELYAEYKVPSSYLSGTQLKLKIGIYSADTSNTFLIQTVSTLLRNNTDLVSSTTNQRTSTNSAITASGANQNKIQIVTCDLTDTTGNINSVAVSANDIIIIKLTRGADTATGNVIFLAKQCEVA